MVNTARHNAMSADNITSATDKRTVEAKAVLENVPGEQERHWPLAFT